MSYFVATVFVTENGEAVTVCAASSNAKNKDKK
jgi:hypothetical protein